MVGPMAGDQPMSAPAPVAVGDVFRSWTRRLILARPEQLANELDQLVTALGQGLNIDVAFVAHAPQSGDPQLGLRATWISERSRNATLEAAAGDGWTLPAVTEARAGNHDFPGVWQVPDVPRKAVREPSLEWLAAAGIQSALLVPLPSDGAGPGVLGLASSESRMWTRDECHHSILLAEVVSAVAARRTLEHGRAGRSLCYRDILDDQTEMICRFTRDLRITYANRAYAVQYGLSAESIIGHSLLEFFPEEKHEWAIEVVASLGRDLPVNRHENEVVFADGTRSWYQWTDTVAFDADGEVAEIQAVGRDVSESHHLAEAMRRSEERFRRAFEDAPIGMAVLDDRNCILRANQALSRFFDVADPADLAGRALIDFIASPDRFEPGSVDEHLQQEVRFQRSDGSSRWAELSLSHFDVEEHETVRLMQVVDLDDRKRAEEQLAHEALHDPLTGLPNRSLLLDRLDVALQRRDRSSGHVAVLFGDLDQFKLVNDSFGHEVGDRLLGLVAQRLSRALRGHDTLARFGGDEFVVLAEGLESPAAGHDLASRLIASLDEPVNLGVAEVSVGLSVGIAMADDVATPSELIRRADTAMYVAKEGDRPRIAFYDGSVEQHSVGRLSLRTELNRAMDNDEFVAVYQPIVDVGGVAIGAEALLRWKRDTAGVYASDPDTPSLLTPGHFLGVAQEMGLIVPLGRRIMERACRQAAEWSATSGRAVQAWVNVCGREMTQHNFVSTVEECLRVSGLQPAQLCLELTEFTVLNDISAVAKTMAQLQAIGVRFALDDFGTGYSALDFLRRFPLDAVKIDGAFVSGLLNHRATDRALVTAIANLGTALGLAVVGEGVERSEQIAVLRDVGVPLLQGYGLAPPAAPESLSHWFRPKGVGEAAA